MMMKKKRGNGVRWKRKEENRKFLQVLLSLGGEETIIFSV